ncbi:hypothetical protein D9M68_799300 [compost metagenome]
MGELIVGGQRRLHIQVDQQHPLARIGNESPQIGRDSGFADAALGRDDGDHLHDALPVLSGTASNALFEAFGDPGVDFGGVPADGPNP